MIQVTLKVIDTKRYIFPYFQDMLVPIADLKAALEVFHSEAEIYPIWLCPFKLPARPGMLKVASNKEEMFVDVGVYGVPKNDRFVKTIFQLTNLSIISSQVRCCEDYQEGGGVCEKRQGVPDDVRGLLHDQRGVQVNVRPHAL